MQLSKPRVVIIGGGFGGLQVAKSINNNQFDVILIDKNNHHLFQPLLYQVASSALSPGDIAIPLRTILRGYSNVQVLMNEVISIDKNNRKVVLSDGELGFDYLVLAPGSRHSYFGNDEWEQFAPGLKNINDAVGIREKVLVSFEKAERIYGTNDAQKYMNFVVVGGGPTGVELAGAIAEISKRTMLPDFPKIKFDDLNIYLIEGDDRILGSYSQNLSDYTKQTLEKLGVKVLLNTRVQTIQSEKVITDKGEFECSNIIWAAGNQASPIIKSLDIELDRAGRAIVEQDLSIPNHSNIFVIGDAAKVLDKNGKELPGIAPVAMQQGRYVAQIIESKKNKENRHKFEYQDKGSMATIGRAKAIAQIGTFEFKGIIAWLLWSLIHVYFLIDFRNRLRVMFEWAWYYISNQPGARLIWHRKMP